MSLLVLFVGWPRSMTYNEDDFVFLYMLINKFLNYNNTLSDYVFCSFYHFSIQTFPLFLPIS